MSGVTCHISRVLVSKTDKFCRHKAVWDKEGEWISANKEGIKVDKTLVYCCFVDLNPLFVC